MALQANDDDEIRQLRTMRSYLAQHQTDIDRLWKRYDRWVIQPIMVTGMNVPAESSSETSSSVESSSEVSSSVVSSSEETSSSVIESSSETSSVVESSSETSSSVTSSETSSSIESSSTTSSEASSSDTSSSDEYSGSCHACDICDCMHDTLYLTIDSYDSFCCGPRTPIDPIPLYWDGANNWWDSGCLTPTGNACHSSSNPLSLKLIRGARFRLYCEDLQLHYEPFQNFNTEPSCVNTLGEQIADPENLSCEPFFVEYDISITCGSRTPSTELIHCTVTT